jgi:hypothetical protein
MGEGRKKSGMEWAKRGGEEEEDLRISNCKLTATAMDGRQPRNFFFFP